MNGEKPDANTKKRGSIPPQDEGRDSTNDLETYTSNPFIVKPASPQH